MKPDIFKIFRSSAGSGKTYRLALEYLKLTLKDYGDFRRILAVTFTNKATNEMKARIIEYLFHIARGEGDREVTNTLCREMDLVPAVLKERATRTLGNVLHSYTDFSVSTIDSFFQRVISAFSRDLGIQGNYHLEFEINRVREEMIDGLFVNLDEDPALKKWLVQFAMSKIESNKSWDIEYDINQLAGQVFMESFERYYEALNTAISDPETLTAVLDGIKEERRKIASRIKKEGAKGMDMIMESGLELSDFSRGITGPAGLFYKMDAGMSVNTSSKYIREGLESRDSWYTKRSGRKEDILRLLDNGLFDHYRKAFDVYRREHVKDNTYEAAQQHFYNLGILSNLLEVLKDYRIKNEVILISDLTHLLRKVIGENDAPFIYERVGSFYNHFLIDEFQDTSRFQWENFLPLVRNSLAAGKFNMIVGDVKQSIYRWRGGDWEILQQGVAQDIAPFIPSGETLSYNWRSLKNIVDFNNALFTTLSEALREDFTAEVRNLPDPQVESDLTTFGERFTEAYRDVLQELPGIHQHKPGGRVDIRFIPGGRDEEDGMSWKEQVLPMITEQIRYLQDRQYAAGDIAILVRTKDEGRIVANHLLDCRNDPHFGSGYDFNIVSSESLFLNASPAVNIVIHFIKLVIDQRDIVAAAQFYYWLTILKSDEKDISYSDLFRKLVLDNGQHDLNRLLLNTDDVIDFASYRSLPLVDLIEEISLLLRLSEHREEGAYLQGLQNTVLEYLELNNNDLHAFIQWWSEEGKERSIKPSMQQNAIHILTIHQSKGLEYRAVMIPFCSWHVDHHPNKENIIWAGVDLPVLNSIPFYPVRYSKKLAETYFCKDYFNEKSMAYMDNLNLLYVAFTRAREVLTVYSELPDRPGRRQTVGDYLLQSIAGQNTGISNQAESPSLLKLGSWDEETHVYQSGEVMMQEKAAHADASYRINEYERGHWPEKIRIRRQPDILQVEDGKSEREKVNYGIMLHDFLSKIETVRDTESVFEAEMRSGKLTAEDQLKLAGMLEDLFRVDQVRDWFSGSWEVRTEVPVLPQKGQIRRMDRVMIRGDRAVVVDYKTGSKREQDIRQVKDYMQILSEMGYAKIEGYVFYLSTHELMKV